MGQVTVRKVVEGPSHLVLRVDLLSDGVGELNNEVILSPSNLVPPCSNTIPAFRLTQIWSGLTDFDVTIKVDTLTPEVLWTQSSGSDSHLDFRSFGGLVEPTVYTNPLAPTDGKLMLSTRDFNVAGKTGTLVLELRKTNQASG